MAIQKITYTDKEAINIDSSIPTKNKCQADDLNEIKTVVNNNADEFTNTIGNITEVIDLINGENI